MNHKPDQPTAGSANIPERGLLCRSRWIDIALITAFAVISFVVFWARGGLSPPVLDLTSDAANIATMAAAQDFPDNFACDSQFRNFTPGFYVAFHVPATRLLYRLTQDYGQAFTLLLLPTLFAYLVAFYLLGTTLFGSRWYGLILATANMILVKGPRDTAWGPFKDALPRFDHAILFALLLALLWRWRGKPWLWPIVFFLAGLGLYVHPVSTPALALMLAGACIGLAICQGNLRRPVLPAIVGLIAFCLPVLPYAFAFTSDQFSAKGVKSVSAEEAREIADIIESRFTGDYLFPGRTVLEYFSRRHMLFGILPCLAVGLLVMHSRHDDLNWAMTGMCVGLISGLIAAAVIIPVAFEVLTPPWEARAFKGELPRALRYIVPITYVVALGAFATAWARLKSRGRYILIALLGVIGAVSIMGLAPRAFRAVQNTKGKASQKKIAVIELVNAVRHNCDPQHRICAIIEDPLIVRYGAIRSLAFAPKDVPNESSLALAKQWLNDVTKFRRIKAIQDYSLRVEEAIKWAQEKEAQYIILDDATSIELLAGSELESCGKILFQNSRFVLIKVPDVLPHPIQ